MACSGTPQVFQNTTVRPLTDDGVITSTIVVSGLDPYLLDVDVRTFLLHETSADLEVTLTSPSGTVVTLTTDNGGSHPDVFNGTVWDDDANPGGQVPYDTNDGLASDHAYADGVLASPLAPEEALAAFRGQNPNGTWTLTVSDDVFGHFGTLNGWSLSLTALPQAIPTSGTTSFSNTTPVTVPTGPGVVSSQVVVSGLPTFLFDVDVYAVLPHTYSSDLDVTIRSPAGTIVTLTTDNGLSQANVFNGTLWNDSADPGGPIPYTENKQLTTDRYYPAYGTASTLVPEEPLAAFFGENPNGTWTLTVSDDAMDDGGTLSEWRLDLRTATCSGGATTTTTSSSTTTSTISTSTSSSTSTSRTTSTSTSTSRTSTTSRSTSTSRTTSTSTSRTTTSIGGTSSSTTTSSSRTTTTSPTTSTSSTSTSSSTTAPVATTTSTTGTVSSSSSSSTTLAPTTTVVVPASTTTTLPPPSCALTPLEGCRENPQGRAAFLLKDAANDARDALRWTMPKGGPASMADLRNPVVEGGAVAVCVYDGFGVGRLAAVVPTGGTCGQRACWKTLGGSGYLFRGEGGAADGVSAVRLKVTASGGLQLSVDGKGGNLPMSSLDLWLPVTVQLVVADRTGGACWQARFMSAHRNDATTFKAP